MLCNAKYNKSQLNGKVWKQRNPQLDGFALLLMRALPKDKGDGARVPSAFEHVVLQGLTIVRVVPH